jgi:mRNA interferase MazF
VPEPARWDVWVVPFPFTDRLAEKRRPALIISADELFRDHGLVWMAMITSTRINRWTSDVEVKDLRAAGLMIPSRVRIAKIAAVEPTRLIARRGRLSVQDVKSVLSGLSRYLPTS